MSKITTVSSTLALDRIKLSHLRVQCLEERGKGASKRLISLSHKLSFHMFLMELKENERSRNHT